MMRRGVTQTHLILLGHLAIPGYGKSKVQSNKSRFDLLGLGK